MNKLVKDFESWNRLQYCRRYCFNCQCLLDHNFEKMYSLGVLKCEHETFSVHRLHEKGVACPFFRPTWDYRLRCFLFGCVE
jgi:hypothetical protein